MIKVKICGITNLKDAVYAAGLGADYLGFNFYEKSLRKVSTKMACAIISKIPAIIEPVGIFVDEETENLMAILKKVPLKLIQLHGTEQPEYIQGLKDKLIQENINIRLIKSFRIKAERSIVNIKRYLDIVDFILLDAYVPGEPGGTGEVFNWDIAIEAKEYGKQIFLAGGLNPENIVEAINNVHPYAVDVCSGVERLPRRKDYDKMKLLISSVKK